MKKATAILAFLIASFMFFSQLIQENRKNASTPEATVVMENVASNADFNMSQKDPLAKCVNIITELDKTSRWILIVAVIAIYAFAWFLSMGDKCIIVYTWWDMILLLICGGIFWTYLFGTNNNVGDSNPKLIVFYIAFALSVIISFIANLKNSFPLNIIFSIVSIITKIILIIVVPIIVLLIISSFAISGTDDNRYKDGTRNNEKTAVVSFLFAFTGLLLTPLVKIKKQSKVADTIDNFSNESYTKRFIAKWNRILYRT